MRWPRQLWAIATKDLRVEVRSREAANSVVPFAGTLLLVFGLAFGPGRTALQTAAPALLWLAVLFAGVLLLRRSFEAEAEDGALEGLVLSPADRSWIYLGKVLAVSVQLVVLEVLTLVGAAFFFDLALGDGLLVVGTFMAGTGGLAGVGVLFAALAARARSREALFPLLLLPVVVPVLVAGIRAVELAVAGDGAAAGSWLALLVAFAVLSVSLGTLAFYHLMEE